LPVIREIESGTGACGTEPSQLTRLDIRYTALDMPTSCSQQPFEITPFTDNAEEGFETVLDVGYQPIQRVIVVA
jgi:hypothetical protein